MTTPKSFKDTEHGSAHADFQQWRGLNPNGFFLNLKTTTAAMLHRTGCGHFEDPTRELSVDWNLTAKEKFCAGTSSDLLRWASKQGVETSNCKDCKPV